MKYNLGTFGLIFILVLSIVNIQAQNKVTLTAKELLIKSIKKHDPNGNWHKLKASFNMKIERSNQPTRLFYVSLNNKKGHFMYGVNSDTATFSQSFSPPDVFSYQLNGSTNISPDSLNKYGLTNTRTIYLREVYEYLFDLPMRLTYDKQFMSQVVGDTIYNDAATHILHFNYIDKGSSETWKFFINKSSYQLEGYQFYKGDITKDGEWITLKDYTEIKGILMPKTKEWYWNKDNSYFRTDKIIDSY